MSRPLPIAAVQTAPHPVEASWSGFAADVTSLAKGLPATKLVI